MHPKDRATFASQITSGVGKNGKDGSSLFVMLRRYRGLKAGFGVVNTGVNYLPYKLTLTFREAPEEMTMGEPSDLISKTTMLLVVSAVPVVSVYKGNFKKLCEDNS